MGRAVALVLVGILIAAGAVAATWFLWRELFMWALLLSPMVIFFSLLTGHILGILTRGDRP